jgi:hypothetical protein
LVEAPVIFLGRASRAAVLIDGAPRPNPVRLARFARMQHRVFGIAIPARIEGGDEHAALALSSELGQPTRRAFAGMKTRKTAM